MAIKNIEININNGNGYDVLYPNIKVGNVIDWKDFLPDGIYYPVVGYYKPTGFIHFNPKIIGPEIKGRKIKYITIMPTMGSEACTGNKVMNTQIVVAYYGFFVWTIEVPRNLTDNEGSTFLSFVKNKETGETITEYVNPKINLENNTVELLNGEHGIFNGGMYSSEKTSDYYYILWYGAN